MEQKTFGNLTKISAKESDWKRIDELISSIIAADTDKNVQEIILPYDDITFVNATDGTINDIFSICCVVNVSNPSDALYDAGKIFFPEVSTEFEHHVECTPDGITLWSRKDTH